MKNYGIGIIILAAELCKNSIFVVPAKAGTQ